MPSNPIRRIGEAEQLRLQGPKPACSSPLGFLRACLLKDGVFNNGRLLQQTPIGCRNKDAPMNPASSTANLIDLLKVRAGIDFKTISPKKHQEQDCVAPKRLHPNKNLNGTYPDQ